MSVFFKISQGKTIFALQKECKIGSSNEYNSIQNLSMSNLDKIEEIEILTLQKIIHTKGII